MQNHQLTDTLNVLLEEMMKNEPIPGLAVSVVKDGQVMMAKGFGVKNRDSQEPVTERSLFHMASVSKTFAALAVVRLAEQKKLGLDSLVTDYLPYFELEDKRYRQITIRHLLSHTSGLPDETHFDWADPAMDDGALERYVTNISHQTLLREPGSAFHYSNIGFEILGDVIQKVSGRTFERYMKEEILTPIGMMDSSFMKADTEAELLTSPHSLHTHTYYGPEVNPIFPYSRFHAPSSTLCSNAVDLATYGSFLLSRGKEIISDEAFSSMTEKHGDTGWGEAVSNVGLSWFLGTYKGRRMFSHNGMDTGYRSSLIVLPEEDLSVAVMINADYIGTRVVWQTIVDVFLGEQIKAVPVSLARRLAKTIAEDGEEAAEDVFVRFEQQKFEGYLVLEGELNFAAYEFFERGQTEEGICLLKMAARIFPQSSNIQDSLGEMHEARQDMHTALHHYKKAVELDPENKEAAANLAALNEKM
ncbi:hypothetical protein CR205_12035 [Alteribacter lacisalsi]|uniref:Beta-lactamase-related domain-containing protein n=1 Tax=Alteribacter lacisalsi TaxID=2045244 RepID=A0A2W0H3P1_9BACI|nr:serine hydrolase [Alteribacter lacisalsi]PYZ96444.1 hypothetical protein CR205_12035 [Alteribacter lacisalsi]